MNLVDWLVLLGTILGIVAYGTWRTRHTDNLNTYLKGNSTTKWGTIGLSVMATQASTITYLSLPGVAAENGIAFIIFGLPLALIVVCAVFLPSTANSASTPPTNISVSASTRKPGSAPGFCVQRGLQAGITIYAPAIILATGARLAPRSHDHLHRPRRHRLHCHGRERGGESHAEMADGRHLRRHDHRLRRPADQAADRRAPDRWRNGKLQASHFTPASEVRYTVWSGILGGFFVCPTSALTNRRSSVTSAARGCAKAGSAGCSTRCRTSDGVLHRDPRRVALRLLSAPARHAGALRNQTVWQQQASGPQGAAFRAIEVKDAPHSTPTSRRKFVPGSRPVKPVTSQLSPPPARPLLRRKKPPSPCAAKPAMHFKPPTAVQKDQGFRLCLHYLYPHPASARCDRSAPRRDVFLGAVLQGRRTQRPRHHLDDRSWRAFRPLAAHDEARNVRVAKWLTARSFAIGFALFVSFAENLIEALNIVASIFYPALLGVFVVAFFLKHVKGTAVFWAAIASQAVVIAIFFFGKAYPARERTSGSTPSVAPACVLFSLGFQMMLGGEPQKVNRG